MIYTIHQELEDGMKTIEMTLDQFEEMKRERDELRQRLEYAYRRIEYGFVHGVFDFSVLRTDASNWLAENTTEE